MKTPDLFPSDTTTTAPRAVMNGKPVFTIPAKTVLNMESGFVHKLLCDGPTFSTGTACVYSCAFCYVPDMMRKLRVIPAMQHIKGNHEDIVIRRDGAIGALRGQLTDRHGQPKYADPTDQRVIYSSPSVDVAGNMDLVRETIEACKTILELTHWHIRLLSKSNLLPAVAKGIPEKYRHRMIYGVSTGTLDDNLARAFEAGTPLVSKRIKALHELQDMGMRTFGMICPSLPQTDYTQFAADMAGAIRADKCEHVWAEAMNVRGESYKRTWLSLFNAGFKIEAQDLETAFSSNAAWENYARKTFEAHALLYGASRFTRGKLRFLQYVKPSTMAWWKEREKDGAILLGAGTH
jgi:DNA repair photolyase